MFSLRKKKVRFCHIQGQLLPGISLILILASSCANPKILNIKNNIEEFKNQEVTLNGEVIETLAIPFVRTGAYQLDDGSGRIWVLSAKNVPERGNQVIVTGTITVGVELGGKRFGVMVKETNKE